MAKPIMVQGTASSAGKSLITAGLCRVFRQDGYAVAPFKSQNMALNSYITGEGLEMGRAQVMQAEAAGIEPSVLMNPILLKPTGDMGCQVIVNGEVLSSMTAGRYYEYKDTLRPAVAGAYAALAAAYDVVVIEGAGSPAEINLNRDDFVNMGMARLADAPVLLVADIDRGGVFASVYGTIKLLTPEEQARVKGVVINKFRGDAEILKPGLKTLEELTGVPVLGVVPFLDIDLDDEDSVTERFNAKASDKPLDIAVLRLPRISNFTDFNALSRLGPVGLRYVRRSEELGSPDLVILPGTKNTMGDLKWLYQTGLADAVKVLALAGTPVIGICGGYQMLGRTLRDPDAVEEGGDMDGLGLLPVDTVFEPAKVRTRVTGRVCGLEGTFAGLTGAALRGYEIHMGKTALSGGGPFSVLSGGVPVGAAAKDDPLDGAVTKDGPPDGAATKDGPYDGAVFGNVFGSYLHGLLDGELGIALVRLLLRRKGLPDTFDAGIPFDEHKERQYDLLAASLRSALDFSAIYEIMGIARH